MKGKLKKRLKALEARERMVRNPDMKRAEHAGQTSGNSMKKEVKKSGQKRESFFKSFTLADRAFLLLALGTLAALILFFVACPDNLMHSDTTAEVILSKLLADENRLITKDWFYSTEIRIVYTQLVMVPLFKIFSDFGTVKLISVILCDLLLVWAYFMLVKRFGMEKKWAFLSLALLLAPLSNEYLDMMFIGCFYTSQTICTYLVLSYVVRSKRDKKSWMMQGIVLSAAALILGLSGLRYLASLYLPMLLAAIWMLIAETEPEEKMEYEQKSAQDAVITCEAKLQQDKKAFLKKQLGGICYLLVMTVAAGIGFLINKFYLAKAYSFDTTSEVTFVPLSEVPDRFFNSIRLMIEFMGYREIQVVTPLGMVNAVKCLFLLLFVGIVLYLWKNRRTLLDKRERFFLYFFVFLFLINWYMLIFTNVLMQYRYWLPVYVTGVLLIGIFMQKVKSLTAFQKPVMALFLAIVVLSSLYGELWQDTKYNDCEKRYGYLEFLEENDYDFGYATFWNASVTEYLTNGQIHVGSIGGDDWGARPYEWLSPKAYYRAGFHEGKTFLLLARTEEAGMLKGDFTIMEDAECVYQDEYYAIYEGQQGMYLFSEGYEP